MAFLGGGGWGGVINFVVFSRYVKGYRIYVVQGFSLSCHTNRNFEFRCYEGCFV
jgi:hypothetical protein